MGIALPTASPRWSQMQACLVVRTIKFSSRMSRHGSQFPVCVVPGALIPAAWSFFKWCYESVHRFIDDSHSCTDLNKEAGHPNARGWGFAISNTAKPD